MMTVDDEPDYCNEISQESDMRIIVSAIVFGVLAACTQEAEVAGEVKPIAADASFTTSVIGITWSGTGACKTVADLQVDSNEECSTLPEKICVKRGDFIKWISVDPEGAGFSLHFDPIQGMPLKAPNGEIMRPIDANAPIADYKYSIVGEGCDPSEANTYDPHIRVEE